MKGNQKTLRRGAPKEDMIMQPEETEKKKAAAKRGRKKRMVESSCDEGELDVQEQRTTPDQEQPLNEVNQISNELENGQ